MLLINLRPGGGGNTSPAFFFLTWQGSGTQLTPQRCLCHRDGEGRSTMPRVKPPQPDPLEMELISEIAAGMAQAKITVKDLADMTGINYSTLNKRIGKKSGDIKTLRIGELIRIRKAIRRKVG